MNKEFLFVLLTGLLLAVVQSSPVFSSVLENQLNKNYDQHLQMMTIWGNDTDGNNTDGGGNSTDGGGNSTDGGGNSTDDGGGGSSSNDKGSIFSAKEVGFVTLMTFMASLAAFTLVAFMRYLKLDDDDENSPQANGYEPPTMQHEVEEGGEEEGADETAAAAAMTTEDA